MRWRATSPRTLTSASGRKKLGAALPPRHFDTDDGGVLAALRKRYSMHLRLRSRRDATSLKYDAGGLETAFRTCHVCPHNFTRDPISLLPPAETPSRV